MAEKQINPLWLEPFKKGYTRHVVHRTFNGKKRFVVKYIAPSGKLMSRMEHVNKYLNDNPDIDLKPECFLFRGRCVHREPEETYQEVIENDDKPVAQNVPDIDCFEDKGCAVKTCKKNNDKDNSTKVKKTTVKSPGLAKKDISKISSPKTITSKGKSPSEIKKKSTKVKSLPVAKEEETLNNLKSPVPSYKRSTSPEFPSPCEEVVMDMPPGENKLVEGSAESVTALKSPKKNTPKIRRTPKDQNDSKKRPKAQLVRKSSGGDDETNFEESVAAYVEKPDHIKNIHKRKRSSERTSNQKDEQQHGVESNNSQIFSDESLVVHQSISDKVSLPLKRKQKIKRSFPAVVQGCTVLNRSDSSEVSPPHKNRKVKRLQTSVKDKNDIAAKQDNSTAKKIVSILTKKNNSLKDQVHSVDSTSLTDESKSMQTQLTIQMEPGLQESKQSTFVEQTSEKGMFETLCSTETAVPETRVKKTKRINKSNTAKDAIADTLVTFKQKQRKPRQLKQKNNMKLPIVNTDGCDDVNFGCMNEMSGNACMLNICNDSGESIVTTKSDNLVKETSKSDNLTSIKVKKKKVSKKDRKIIKLNAGKEITKGVKVSFLKNKCKHTPSLLSKHNVLKAPLRKRSQLSCPENRRQPKSKEFIETESDTLSEKSEDKPPIILKLVKKKPIYETPADSDQSSRNMSQTRPFVSPNRLSCSSTSFDPLAPTPSEIDYNGLNLMTDSQSDINYNTPVGPRVVTKVRCENTSVTNFLATGAIETRYTSPEGGDSAIFSPVDLDLANEQIAEELDDELNVDEGHESCPQIISPPQFLSKVTVNKKHIVTLPKSVTHIKGILGYLSKKTGMNFVPKLSVLKIETILACTDCDKNKGTSSCSSIDSLNSKHSSGTNGLSGFKKDHIADTLLSRFLQPLCPAIDDIVVAAATVEKGEGTPKSPESTCSNNNKKEHNEQQTEAAKSCEPQGDHRRVVAETRDTFPEKAPVEKSWIARNLGEITKHGEVKQNTGHQHTKHHRHAMGGSKPKKLDCPDLFDEGNFEPDYVYDENESGTSSNLTSESECSANSNELDAREVLLEDCYKIVSHDPNTNGPSDANRDVNLHVDREVDKNFLLEKFLGSSSSDNPRSPFDTSDLFFSGLPPSSTHQNSQNESERPIERESGSADKQNKVENQNCDNHNSLPDGYGNSHSDPERDCTNRRDQRNVEFQSQNDEKNADKRIVFEKQSEEVKVTSDGSSKSKPNTDQTKIIDSSDKIRGSDSEELYNKSNQRELSSETNFTKESTLLNPKTTKINDKEIEHHVSKSPKERSWQQEPKSGPSLELSKPRNQMSKKESSVRSLVVQKKDVDKDGFIVIQTPTGEKKMKVKNVKGQFKAGVKGKKNERQVICEVKRNPERFVSKMADGKRKVIPAKNDNLEDAIGSAIANCIELPNTSSSASNDTQDAVHESIQKSLKSKSTLENYESDRQNEEISKNISFDFQNSKSSVQPISEDQLMCAEKTNLCFEEERPNKELAVQLEKLECSKLKPPIEIDEKNTDLSRKEAMEKSQKSDCSNPDENKKDKYQKQSECTRDKKMDPKEKRKKLLQEHSREQKHKDLRKGNLSNTTSADVNESSTKKKTLLPRIKAAIAKVKESALFSEAMQKEVYIPQKRTTKRTSSNKSGDGKSKTSETEKNKPNKDTKTDPLPKEGSPNEHDLVSEVRSDSTKSRDEKSTPSEPDKNKVTETEQLCKEVSPNECDLKTEGRSSSNKSRDGKSKSSETDINKSNKETKTGQKPECDTNSGVVVESNSSQKQSNEVKCSKKHSEIGLEEEEVMVCDKTEHKKPVFSSASNKKSTAIKKPTEKSNQIDGTDKQDNMANTQMGNDTNIVVGTNAQILDTNYATHSKSFAKTCIVSQNDQLTIFNENNSEVPFRPVSVAPNSQSTEHSVDQNKQTLNKVSTNTVKRNYDSTDEEDDDLNKNGRRRSKLKKRKLKVKGRDTSAESLKSNEFGQKSIDRSQSRDTRRKSSDSVKSGTQSTDGKRIIESLNTDEQNIGIQKPAPTVEKRIMDMSSTDRENLRIQEPAQSDGKRIIDSSNAVRQNLKIQKPAQSEEKRVMESSIADRQNVGIQKPSQTTTKHELMKPPMPVNKTVGNIITPQKRTKVSTGFLYCREDIDLSEVCPDSPIKGEIVRGSSMYYVDCPFEDEHKKPEQMEETDLEGDIVFDFSALRGIKITMSGEKTREVKKTSRQTIKHDLSIKKTIKVDQSVPDEQVDHIVKFIMKKNKINVKTCEEVKKPLVNLDWNVFDEAVSSAMAETNIEEKAPIGAPLRVESGGRSPKVATVQPCVDTSNTSKQQQPITLSDLQVGLHQFSRVSNSVKNVGFLSDEEMPAEQIILSQTDNKIDNRVISQSQASVTASCSVDPYVDNLTEVEQIIPLLPGESLPQIETDKKQKEQVSNEFIQPKAVKTRRNSSTPVRLKRPGSATVQQTVTKAVQLSKSTTSRVQNSAETVVQQRNTTGTQSSGKQGFNREPPQIRRIVPSAEVKKIEPSIPGKASPSLQNSSKPSSGTVCKTNTASQTKSPTAVRTISMKGLDGTTRQYKIKQMRKVEIGEKTVSSKHADVLGQSCDDRGRKKSARTIVGEENNIMDEVLANKFTTADSSIPESFNDTSLSSFTAKEASKSIVPIKVNVENEYAKKTQNKRNIDQDIGDHNYEIVLPDARIEEYHPQKNNETIRIKIEPDESPEASPNIAPDKMSSPEQGEVMDTSSEMTCKDVQSGSKRKSTENMEGVAAKRKSVKERLGKRDDISEKVSSFLKEAKVTSKSVERRRYSREGSENNELSRYAGTGTQDLEYVNMKSRQRDLLSKLNCALAEKDFSRLGKVFLEFVFEPNMMTDCKYYDVFEDGFFNSDQLANSYIMFLESVEQCLQDERTKSISSTPVVKNQVSLLSLKILFRALKECLWSDTYKILYILKERHIETGDEVTNTLTKAQKTCLALALHVEYGDIDKAVSLLQKEEINWLEVVPGAPNEEKERKGRLLSLKTLLQTILNYIETNVRNRQTNPVPPSVLGQKMAEAIIIFRKIVERSEEDEKKLSKYKDLIDLNLFYNRMMKHTLSLKQTKMILSLYELQFVLNQVSLQRYYVRKIIFHLERCYTTLHEDVLKEAVKITKHGIVCGLYPEQNEVRLNGGRMQLWTCLTKWELYLNVFAYMTSMCTVFDRLSREGKNVSPNSCTLTMIIEDRPSDTTFLDNEYSFPDGVKYNDFAARTRLVTCMQDFFNPSLCAQVSSRNSCYVERDEVVRGLSWIWNSFLEKQTEPPWYRPPGLLQEVVKNLRKTQSCNPLDDSPSRAGISAFVEKLVGSIGKGGQKYASASLGQSPVSHRSSSPMEREVGSAMKQTTSTPNRYLPMNSSLGDKSLPQYSSNLSTDGELHSEVQSTSEYGLPIYSDQEESLGNSNDTGSHYLQSYGSFPNTIDLSKPPPALPFSVGQTQSLHSTTDPVYSRENEIVKVSSIKPSSKEDTYWYGSSNTNKGLNPDQDILYHASSGYASQTESNASSFANHPQLSGFDFNKYSTMDSATQKRSDTQKYNYERTWSREHTSDSNNKDKFGIPSKNISQDDCRKKGLLGPYPSASSIPPGGVFAQQAAASIPSYMSQQGPNAIPLIPQSVHCNVPSSTGNNPRNNPGKSIPSIMDINPKEFSHQSAPPKKSQETRMSQDHMISKHSMLSSIQESIGQRLTVLIQYNRIRGDKNLRDLEKSLTEEFFAKYVSKEMVQNPNLKFTDALFDKMTFFLDTIYPVKNKR